MNFKTVYKKIYKTLNLNIVVYRILKSLYHYKCWAIQTAISKFGQLILEFDLLLCSLEF